MVMSLRCVIYTGTYIYMHASSNILLDIHLITLYAPFYCYMCMRTYVYIYMTNGVYLR